MNLECPKCGHNWDYKGNSYRAPCPMCRWKRKETVYIKTGLPFKKWKKQTSSPTSPPTSSPTSPPTSSISDDIMNGNILEAHNKKGVF